MFTRTLSVGSVLEVRPSASTASPCISGSARLQISRLLSCGNPRGSRTSWRHLHTSFRDPPQCSVVHQYPGLLGLLARPRVDTSAVEEATPQQISPVADDAHQLLATGVHGDDRSAPSPTMSAANAVRDLFISRAANFAHLARPPSHGLERRCAELVLENQQLKAGMNASSLRIRKVQDLNLRLCSELKQVRHQHDAERKAAVHHISGLRHQMRRRGLRLRRMLGLRRCRRARAQRAKPPRQDALQEADPVPVATGDDQVEELDGAEADVRCSCGDMHCLGCTLHRTYSNALLLAHRDTSLRISLGAPGLQLPDTAQSLKNPGAGYGWHLLVLPKAQEKRRHVHGRRQERLKERVAPDRPPGL
mmetsp:Transcript_35542/g.62745  ORF Transcript_35542/g.62745 Transcript_35542/m.62745 type:complete len:363 (+) Transcript_35542:83-1171(+)